MALEKGQLVRIYKDPITCNIAEGDAVLGRKEKDLSRGSREWWWVRFHGESEDCLREIVDLHFWVMSGPEMTSSHW